MIVLKGYNIDKTLKDRLQNEFNNEYGIDLKSSKENISTFQKPRNIINSNLKNIKR